MKDAQYRALLAARRAQLVQRAHDQRQDLAYRALPLLDALTWVERGVGVWRQVQAHPWAVLAPIAALALWRPRSVLRALPVLLTVWRLVA
jgi:YqjK-like protein